MFLVHFRCNLPASANVTLVIREQNEETLWSPFSDFSTFFTAPPRRPEAPEEITRGVLYETTGVSNVTAGATGADIGGPRAASASERAAVVRNILLLLMMVLMIHNIEKIETTLNINNEIDL